MATLNNAFEMEKVHIMYVPPPSYASWINSHTLQGITF